MCGIAGIFLKNNQVETAVLKKMTDSIVHRGPDGEGHWISISQRLGFGHRRLSIIDLSTDGAQPMHYLDRYTITFNGEIYNYLEIKEILVAKGYQFRSKTDTEVLLAAYDYWGVECLQFFDGMFSFALWDEKEQKLFCARDRFGEKPFYYHIADNGDFYFGSEQKELWATGIEKKVSEHMLYYYMMYDVTENANIKSQTFYSNILKLEASHYLIIDSSLKITKQKYWEIDINNFGAGYSFKEATERFYELLYNSIERRMRSDVPVGSSLSGGIDSSTIVTIANEITKNELQHTFSARFKNSAKDEGSFLDILTSKIKVTRNDIHCESDSMINEIDKILHHQEEPFQTGSIIAQWQVYQRAKREGVLVMLDGQGADEYLGGYFKDFNPYMRELYKTNKSLFEITKIDLKNTHGYSLKNDFGFKTEALIPNIKSKVSHITRKYRKVKNQDAISQNILEKYKNETPPFANFNTLKETFKFEMSQYGIEKLLKIADRNSMAHSIEVRLPFLSHELVEFVFSLPSSFYFTEGWSKSILRNAMSSKLPKEICWRKDKIGFEAPSSEWIQISAMKDIIEESKKYLIKENIVSKGYSDDWNAVMMYKFLTNK